jgi:hypothetical protein
LLVANDSTPNYLYRNKGDGTFEDLSFESGYTVNGDGRETASMGIALGDYENKGKLDILNTTFSDDYKVLYRNDGDLSFTDVSHEVGLAAATIPFLSWGDGFIDYDNDGWKDIFIASGHVYRGRSTRLRHQLRRAVYFSGIFWKEVRACTGRQRHGTGGRYSCSGRSFWRSVQRRQDRCCLE